MKPLTLLQSIHQELETDVDIGWGKLELSSMVAINFYELCDNSSILELSACQGTHCFLTVGDIGEFHEHLSHSRAVYVGGLRSLLAILLLDEHTGRWVFHGSGDLNRAHVSKFAALFFDVFQNVFVLIVVNKVIRSDLKRTGYK